ncbi:MAG: arsenate reductase (glutaredoxin) [Candidatus Marinimicrobia bacterium]|nr:arsenate reductase (glutaredoxin) [Candidatus Neomarinimicrobiota bacterium]
MSDVIIYHNPRCRKSREGLQILKDAGLEPVIVKYLENPPTVEELNNIIDKLELHPYELIRKNEKEFRELNLKEMKEDRNALIQAMSENPRLIQRPIVVKGDKAILGRPPENIKEIF